MSGKIPEYKSTPPTSILRGTIPPGKIKESDRRLFHDDERPIGAGLARNKVQGGGAEHLSSVLAAKQSGEYARYEKGEIPMTAEAFAALTGISVDSDEAQRLEAKVKEVAKRIGVDHEVGFATELPLDPYSSCTQAFLGLFQGWNRPGQPIFLGVGLKARSADDLEMLYKFQNNISFPRGLPTTLKLYLEDFVKMSEEERIEAVLVHEKHELDAVDYSKTPHHTAVAEGPTTPFEISPRVRQHLELWARVNRSTFGDVG